MKAAGITVVMVALGCAPLAAAVHEVTSAEQLARVLRKLEAGDTVKIGPGDYPGGHSVGRIANLTIEALDPARRPRFVGGNQAWHFTRCDGLVVRDLIVQGQSANGINLDDGGEREKPVERTLLERITVLDIGPQGNFDGIKASGLSGLEISDCTVTGWGGQAIDFVGCRASKITGCTFTGKPGFSQHTGPQFKGGCEDIVIEKCVFREAGQRPLQAGGSTGMDFFRPPGAKYEARRISIRENRFEGGDCAAAFTGVDGAEFRGNTILRPKRWIFRVLQETTARGFAPCRNVVIADNTITFRRGDIRSEINIGGGTEPESFRFEKNRWLAEDEPELSRPQLPVPETGGRYGR